MRLCDKERSRHGERSGRGHCPLRRKFVIFYDMARFVDFLVLNLVTKTVMKYTQNARRATEIDLHAIKSVICLL